VPYGELDGWHSKWERSITCSVSGRFERTQSVPGMSQVCPFRGMNRLRSGSAHIWHGHTLSSHVRTERKDRQRVGQDDGELTSTSSGMHSMGRGGASTPSIPARPGRTARDMSVDTERTRASKARHGLPEGGCCPLPIVWTAGKAWATRGRRQPRAIGISIRIVPKNHRHHRLPHP
jgi:hypothetical protein